MATELSRTAAPWPSESVDRRAECCRAWLVMQGLLTGNESAAVKGRMKKRKRKGKVKA